MKKLFLLDGHALVYRAHFAFITRPLFNSKGLNVSAIHGFMRTLWDLVNAQQPTHLAVMFDPPGGTFRHERYEEYKANRDAQPEDISVAIPWIERLLEAMRIPMVMKAGYEADDVIGTIAKQAEQEGFVTYMVTPDKDYGQLVTPQTLLYKPARMGNDIEIWGPTEVCANWGIRRVSQVIDMLALMGDAVDNIPGLPGIGEKTAAKLLDAFDSVENLLASTDQLKGKQQEIVRTHADRAVLSKWLATIDTQVPITFNAEQYRLESFDREQLIALFQELEFRSLADAVLRHPLAGGGTSSANKPAGRKSANATGTQGSLFGDTAAGDAAEDAAPLADHTTQYQTIADRKPTYHLVDTPEARAALVKKLLAAPAVCFDTETTALDATRAELVGLSFALDPNEAWYVPVPADHEAAQVVVEAFRPVLEAQHIEKTGQNIKYDILVLKNYGVEVSGALWDTMLAHYLWEPDLRHNMNFLAETYLNYTPIKIESLIGAKGAKQGTMRDVPLEKIKDYAAEDADVTLQLRQFLAPKLAENNLEKLFHEVENPLIPVLAHMEHAGVRIDASKLKVYSVELGEKIVNMEAQIIDKAGFQFNVGSPKQVGEVLFDRLKLPYPGKKMKSGQYSTDEEVLSALAVDHPICADILIHRGLLKLKSTYVDALPALIHPGTGRVHSQFNQTIASTGRLSSQNPNLQNIPIRTAEGRKIREAFIPADSDHVLLSADYSQIELRLIAAISGDEAMLEAFRNHLDIHQATAARVFGVGLDEVTADQRRAAKTVNFSIIYGAGAFNLSQQLGLKRQEAKELIDNYFREYAGLQRYMEKTLEFARANGYVETKMGRRRYLRDIDSRNAAIRRFSERIAINMPIQGTAADMIKVAMVNIYRTLQAAHFRTRMILQVHDELVFDVPRAEVELVKPIIQTHMVNALPDIDVPILVEIGVGDTWLAAH